MSIPIKKRFVLALIATLAGIFLTLLTAVQLPVAGGSWQIEQGQLIYTDHNNRYEITTVIANDQSYRANPLWLIEEPDILETHTEFNQLLTTIGSLEQALMEGNLELKTRSGEIIPVALDEREIADLPALFWIQLICGSGGLLLSLCVWLPADKKLEHHAFALTGIGYFFSAAAASIYSTRELFIAHDLFFLLQQINFFGSSLFAFALVLLLWGYPHRFISPKWFGLILLGQPVIVLIDTLQLSPHHSLVRYVPLLLGLMIALVGLACQWWLSRQQISNRLIVRWLLISVSSGTLIFTSAIILPVVLNLPPPASQSVVMGTFLFMYIGMMLAVIRFRLFELERWSFSLWTWFLGGVAVLIMDIILATLLSLSGVATLSLSLAVVGWLYFPVRQWIWLRFFAPSTSGLEDWLQQALPIFLRPDDGTATISATQEAFQVIFKPLKIHVEPTADSAILDNGEALRINDLDHHCSYRLHHPEQGARLFSSRDLTLAQMVIALYQLVHSTQQAHARGASEERLRIKQDLHDDLGAKLLRLLHRTDSDNQLLVREAIRDLRTLLNKQQQPPQVRIGNILPPLQAEVETLCDERGIELTWECCEQVAQVQTDKAEHVERIIREAIANAFRHAKPSELRIRLQHNESEVIIDIENDGVAPANTTRQPGFGTLAQRCKALGAKLRSEPRQDRWQVLVHWPIG